MSRLDELRRMAMILPLLHSHEGETTWYEDPRWSDPADTQSFLHDRGRPLAHSLIDQYMKSYEQQTKKAMTKFKKGDRVKVIRESSINLGCEGVVTHTFPDSRSYTVDLDDMGSVAFSESSLTLVDQPISTTPDKVLQAAKTSPQAKDALKALFPDVFKDEDGPLRIEGEPGNHVLHTVTRSGRRAMAVIGGGRSGGEGSYLAVQAGFDARVRKDKAYGTTVIEFFHKKP